VAERGSRAGPKAIQARRQPWSAASVLGEPAAVTDARRFEHSVVSPLRYPGAKRQLVPVIERIIRSQSQPPRLFVEPFCGGASAAIRMAGTGTVPFVVLADADELVASFWHAAAFDTNWLITSMQAEEVSVRRWDWWRMASPRTRRERALKCLFLNRTTFSGILHGRAGPIGGRRQTSKYPIDCRFNKDTLAARIRAVGELAAAGRIVDVWHLGWSDSLRRVTRDFGGILEPDEIFVYLDPPYVEKAPFLYEWSFEDDQHKTLAAELSEEQPFKWLLSYDENDLVKSLYPASPTQRMLTVKHRYTAASAKAPKAAKATEAKKSRAHRDEILVTNITGIEGGDGLEVVPS